MTQATETGLSDYTQDQLAHLRFRMETAAIHAKRKQPYKHITRDALRQFEKHLKLVKAGAIFR